MHNGQSLQASSPTTTIREQVVNADCALTKTSSIQQTENTLPLDNACQICNLSPCPMSSPYQVDHVRGPNLNMGPPLFDKKGSWKSNRTESYRSKRVLTGLFTPSPDLLSSSCPSNSWSNPECTKPILESELLAVGTAFKYNQQFEHVSDSITSSASMDLVSNIVNCFRRNGLETGIQNMRNATQEENDLRYTQMRQTFTRTLTSSISSGYKSFKKPRVEPSYPSPAMSLRTISSNQHRRQFLGTSSIAGSHHSLSMSEEDVPSSTRPSSRVSSPRRSRQHRTEASLGLTGYSALWPLQC